MTSSGTAIRPLIYQIINLVNGRFYIGVTKPGLRLRRLQHLREAKRGKLDFPIYRAIRKYGEGAFVFVPLCEFDTYEEALTKEIELIAVMKPAYNAARGGQGTSYWTGKRRDAATNLKISQTKTGVPRGYTPPHALEVFKENMLRAARSRRKPVKCLTSGEIFESAAAASLHYKFHPTAVAAVASGRRKKICGMKFEYMAVQ